MLQRKLKQEWGTLMPVWVSVLRVEKETRGGVTEVIDE
jgi:hypothetical protein